MNGAARTDGPPSLAVVIVTHDSAATLARTLVAIGAELRDGDELIVVDNASTDGTRELVADLAPSARLIA
ncbi:MAG: glycosyltransferase, partial [Thermoleophilia bacterium]|nr:glycosyltransferase [Thermoleophilia bacterium]